MLSEFDLIARFFTHQPRAGGAVTLGVGDDCALLTPPAGELLAVSTDMLVEGRHFFAGTDPEALGHKTLAVNLSDLAAMGARPVAFTLALALPTADASWLEGFARGLLTLANAHDIELVGGDTTRGPLNLCVTVFGSVPAAHVLRRDGAGEDDEIWVSGSLGDARLALEALQGKLALTPERLARARPRLDRPQPRTALGLALRGIATAAIDVSDGLLGDLGHILERSGGGAVLAVDALPCGDALSSEPVTRRRDFALNGGDDYELCFTAPATRHAAVIAAAQRVGVPVTCIGRRAAEAGIQLIDGSGTVIAVNSTSFDHFTSS